MKDRDINKNIYVLAVSKRARQLLRGAKPLVDTGSETNVVKIAKEEIDRGLVIPILPEKIMEGLKETEEESEKET